MATIKPGPGKALLRQIEGPEKTEGGIIIPECARDGQTVKPLDAENRGEVIALGKDGYLYNNDGGYELDDYDRRIPSPQPEVKPGDVVRFEWHCGEVPDRLSDGARLFFVRFQDLVAVEVPN